MFLDFSRFSMSVVCDQATGCAWKLTGGECFWGTRFSRGRSPPYSSTPHIAMENFTHSYTVDLTHSIKNLHIQWKNSPKFIDLQMDFPICSHKKLHFEWGSPGLPTLHWGDLRPPFIWRFPKMGYPNSWMVHSWKIPIYNGWFEGTPILGNHQVKHRLIT